MPDPDPEALRIGRAIRSIRGYHGLTLEGLADLAGLNHRHLSELERGRADPKWSTLVRIADALDVPVSDIVRAYENPPGTRRAR